jgi:hypothetical protein
VCVALFVLFFTFDDDELVGRRCLFVQSKRLLFLKFYRSVVAGVDHSCNVLQREELGGLFFPYIISVFVFLSICSTVCCFLFGL